MSSLNIEKIHSELEISLNEKVLELIINRPQRKNALYGSLYLALEEVLLQVNNSSDINIVILRGSDKDFTAGNDLQDFEESGKIGINAPPFRLLKAVAQLKKPLIIAVRGVAIGIGTTLLLHADLVYCDNTARFQLPFTSLGLSPEGGASLLLPKQIGYHKAAELLMFAKPFHAETAEKLGLVNEIIDKNLYVEVYKKAQELAKLPNISLQLTKTLLKNAENAQIIELINNEGEIFLQRMKSSEFQEAIKIFSEKRTENFTKFHP